MQIRELVGKNCQPAAGSSDIEYIDVTWIHSQTDTSSLLTDTVRRNVAQPQRRAFELTALLQYSGCFPMTQYECPTCRLRILCFVFRWSKHDSGHLRWCTLNRSVEGYQAKFVKPIEVPTLVSILGVTKGRQSGKEVCQAWIDGCRL